MEESFIYDDLINHGDLGATIHDLQTKNNELQSHVSSLQEDIEKLCNKITEMQKVQDSLSKNISLLYNTAKNELERKDRRIDELQTRLDELIFKRMTPHSGFKRKWEDSHSDEMSKRSCTKTLEAPELKKCEENSGEIECKEKICHEFRETSRFNTDKDSDSHRYSHRQNYSSNKESSKEDGYSRDTRESRRDRRDNHKDINRDRGNHRDVNIDERERRRGYRDNYRESRDNNRYYRDRDKSRGRNEDHRSHRENRKISGDDKSSRRSDLESHLEHRNRQHSGYNIKHQHENLKQRSYHEHIPHTEEAQKEKDQQFHSVLSTETFETVKSLNNTEDDSKEEGEVSDEEMPKQNILKNESRKTKIDIGENMPFDDKKSFNVYKFIEGQQKRNTRKKSNAQRTLETNNDKMKTVGVNLEKLKNDYVEKIKDNEKPFKKKVKKVEKDNIEANSIKKACNTEICANENNKCQLTDKTNETGNSNVNIISHIVLFEGNKGEPVLSASEPQLKEPNRNETKVEKKTDEPSKTISNVDKRKRESRVPRNLTDELNINLERSKTRQELILKLFGSAEKRSPMYSLSDEGEIPNLKLFSDPDSSEMTKNDVMRGANPVTEFQIFKSNLPCLEKSNSLSSISVQIQTPTKEGKETPQKHSSHKEKVTTKREDVKKNEDLDMLNIDIKQYNVEDFPNLTAYSDSMVELDSQMKYSKKKNEASAKILVQMKSEENIVKDRNIMTSTSEILKEDNKEISHQNKLLGRNPQQCSTPKISGTGIVHSLGSNHNITPNLSSETDDDPQLNYSLQGTYPLLTPIKDFDHLTSDKSKDAKTEIMDNKKKLANSSIKKCNSPTKLNIITQKPNYQNKTDGISSQKKENLKPILDKELMNYLKQKDDQSHHALERIICSSSKEKTIQNLPKKSINSTEENKSTMIGKVMDTLAPNTSKRPITRGRTKPKDQSNLDDKVEAQNCLQSKNKNITQTSHQNIPKAISEGLANHTETKALNSANDADGISSVEPKITNRKEHCRTDQLNVSISSKNQSPSLLPPVKKIVSKKLATIKMIEKNAIDENLNAKTSTTKFSWKNESTQKKEDEIKSEKDHSKVTAAKSPNNLDKRKRRCTIKIL